MQETKNIYYIAAGFDWRPGDKVSNATFAQAPHKSFFVKIVPSQFADNKDYLARRNTELSLEHYRIEMFPHLPSRKDAIFLNRTLDDAIRWRQLESRSSYNLYKLLAHDEKNSWEVNYIWYNYCVRLQKNPTAEFKRVFGNTPEIDFGRSIQAYWENIPTEQFMCPSRQEVLYTGTLEVIEKIV